MSDRLVTIARFSTPIEAQLARARLEAEGIPCYLANEAHAQMNGGLGGVQLQVAEGNAQSASEALRQDDSATGGLSALEANEANEAELLRCIVCQSSLIEAKQPPLLVRILRGLLLQIVPLPPEWFESGRRRCGVCGHEWKPEPPIQPGPGNVGTAGRI